MAQGSEVLVPAARVERWVLNFGGRHGGTALGVAGGALTGSASDGSTFTARLPLGASYSGLPDAAGFAAAVAAPAQWGVLLVRKGGFAVARLEGERHGRVQGRAAARPGPHQGRWAEPAALRPTPRQPGAPGLRGGRRPRRADPGRAAPRLAGRDRGRPRRGGRGAGRPGLDRLVVVGPWLAVPDPRRAVLEQAVADALSVRVEVTQRLTRARPMLGAVSTSG